MKLTSCDVVYVSSRDDRGSPIGVPSDLAQGVPYYLVQVAGDSARLATTPGGAPVACNAAAAIAFTCDPHGAYDPLTTPAPTGLTADDYAPIHRAALVMAQRAGHPDVSPLIINKIQAFTARIDNSKWATWDMAI